MDLKDIKEVLSFAAFRPEPDNPRFAWPQRFPRMKTVLVNVNRDGCNWAFLDKKGNVENTGESEGQFMDVASQMAEAWRGGTEDGWIGISVNNRFIISLEHNLSRKSGWDEELRQNPKTILGTKYDRSKRYAIHHNPETSASLMMACDDSMIKTIEEAMRSHNLRPARICSGLFAMTASFLNRVASDNHLKSQDLILVTWLEGSLCILRQKNGQWQDLRCRSGLPPQDEMTVTQMINPFVEAADASTRVVLMEDKKNGGFSQKYLSLFGNLHVTDATEEHNLWNILGKH